MRKFYFLKALFFSILLANISFAQSSYTVDQTGVFNPIDISSITVGAGTIVPLDDDEVSSVLPIGFDFNFYGNIYTEFYISSNGFITFSSGQSEGCCSGQFLPDSASPNNLIAMGWEDLDPGNGGQPMINVIRYLTVGTAPNRVLVVEFYNVDHFSSGNNVTFQAQLYEGTNRIEIHTTTMPSDGGTHTQGVENIDGTAAVAVPGRNAADYSLTNDVVAFDYDSMTNTYTVDQTGTFNPIDIAGQIIGTSTELILGDDEVSDANPIGFPFEFYGNVYSDFYISSNGFMTFSSGQSSGCCTGQNIPNTSNPNNLIAMGWEDLDPGNGGQPIINVIRYLTVGNAPNRILVVEFFNVDHWSSGNNVTFQAQLYEGTNRIEIHTTAMPSDGGNHTQGVENIDGTAAVAVPGRNAADYSLTNDYVAFVPTVGETQVRNSQCGSTMSAYNTIVYANSVSGAQAYRFRVTNLATDVVVDKDYALRNLYMSSLSNFIYNQEFNVKVAVKKNGIWGAFGPTCSIITPNPSTELRTADCGSTFDRNQVVYANLVSLATGYRFHVINLYTGSEQFIDRPLRSLYLSSITDYLTDAPALRGVGGGANQYIIEVAARNTDGTYLNYGNFCFITINFQNQPAAPMREIAIDDKTNAIFKVVAYPNPFDNNFKVELNTNSESNVTIAVYDMLGKQLENRQVNANDVNTIAIGSNLASGVYNVIVNQGDKTQSLKMIKR